MQSASSSLQSETPQSITTLVCVCACVCVRVCVYVCVYDSPARGDL